MSINFSDDFVIRGTTIIDILESGEELDLEIKENLLSFLNNWLNDYIFEHLHNLINLIKVLLMNKIFTRFYNLYE